MYSEFINELLKEAAAVARASFGKVSGIIKGEDSNQVLTDADTEIAHLLVRRIQAAYPTHNLIDEETGVVDKQSEFTWVIDPIDGTSNFAKGVIMYGIMIGLLHLGEAVAAGVVLPELNEYYLAKKGKGSFCNGEKLQVDYDTPLSDSLVAYGVDGYRQNPELTKEETALLAEIILACRNLRSSNSCFDLMMVAKGKYGASLHRSTKIWDNVAPQLIIQEAGGLCTDFYGAPVNYQNLIASAEQNFTWCAGSPRVHSELQKIIHRRLP